MLPLSERQRHILFEVVEAFVDSGLPVSSNSIASCTSVDVSSATVRHVMSDLESLGLLMQPHTSAGRIPTPWAMRQYVDALSQEPMKVNPSVDIETALLGWHPETFDEAARGLGAMLSQVAKLTSVISLPNVSQACLTDVHLSALSQNRVLVVLVTADGRVFNRVVLLDFETPDGVSLQKMQNYLSELVLGLTLEEVRLRVRLELEQAEREYNQFVRQALSIGSEALEVATPVLYVEGKLSLFEYSEFTHDVDRLRDVLSLLEEKEAVLELLDRLCDSQEASVFIGPELQWEFDDVSVIVCGYARDGATVGALGLLGPVRIDYARVIPLVEQSARLLSRVLQSSHHMDI